MRDHDCALRRSRKQVGEPRGDAFVKLPERLTINRVSIIWAPQFWAVASLPHFAGSVAKRLERGIESEGNPRQFRRLYRSMGRADDDDIRSQTAKRRPQRNGLATPVLGKPVIRGCSRLSRFSMANENQPSQSVALILGRV